jgi:predicted nucleic acid-binding protein
MICVLDTSAALEIVLRRKGAKRFLDRLLVAERVITSELFRAEAANALAKYVKGGYLSRDDAAKALSFITDMPDTYSKLAENEVEAFAESVKRNHPAYDMFYFTLARRHDALFLTCDKKLAELCRAEKIPVISAVPDDGE